MWDTSSARSRGLSEPLLPIQDQARLQRSYWLYHLELWPAFSAEEEVRNRNVRNGDC
jgi:hypothetical protein